ncbi:MAG TPA: serine hydrolase [Bryobacteraceae bacterium]|nr:serine hydrolase [Bryobacteraceae bacterium]
MTRRTLLLGWVHAPRRAALDAAFEFARLTSKHGGLLVAHRGRLVYERYFGRAHPEATPNNASIGKSFTSIATGILLRQRPDLFPDGLDQRVFTERYLPAELFPLNDARKREIRLGQLLAMTAGIRGNNPGVVRGREVKLDPPGRDGWQGMVDETAFHEGLWCDPGGGYSYATSSPHLVSMMLRHVTGIELEQFVRTHIAGPLRWGRFGWGYRQHLKHTGGGGGVAAQPRDMLRFASMLVQKGQWNGRQVIPRDYVEHCSRSSPYNPHYPYSLQFHGNDTGFWPDLPRDLFWKTGSGGHCIYMAPSLELAVYKMGGRDDQYDSANTGLEPAPGFRYDGSREGWKPAAEVKSADVYAETLRRLLRGFL